ncbi:MAG: hypothetical protein NVSMB27_18340 [Ktedonobacteraceae bacterium]
MANNSHSIGRYRITEEIASGAFGRVYRGEDTTSSNAMVAIKIMHSAHLASSQERNSFLQEAQFLKMLKHPYILPVLEVGINKEIPYLVTEYAPNSSLLDRLAKVAPRPLPVQEALLIISQIGQALQYAHRQNIIHRDLKPANILFKANGDAVLADFGIATMLATSMKYGTAIGTPCYMAPEQFRGSISKEGDQYALGCIAYELFTGRTPFAASDFFALGFKHMSETPLAPTQLNLLMPRAVEMAILKAMAKQRADRHTDITAFLSALGVSALPPAEPSSVEVGVGLLSEVNFTGETAWEGTSSRRDPIDRVPEGGEDVGWGPSWQPAGSVNNSGDRRYPVQGTGNSHYTMDDEQDLPNPHIGTKSESSRTSRSLRFKWFIAVTIVLLLLVMLGSVSYAFFYLPTLSGSKSRAIVTITPTSTRTRRANDIFYAVMGIPNPAQHQVAARMLSTTLTQSRTLQLQGTLTAPAVQGKGTLTFFNDSTSPQFFSAGGVYTGSDGVTITNDAGGTVPAGNPNTTPPTWKTITVPAHSISAGEAGNIKKADISIWTAVGLKGSFVVQNTAAFTGGADEQHYAVVQQSDLYNAANPTALFHSTQAALWAQVKSNEASIGSTQCRPHMLYDNAVGSKATSVTATVTVTCTVEVYDLQAVQSMATQLLAGTLASAGANNRLVATVSRATVVDAKGTIALLVNAASLNIFQFSTAQMHELATLIAGKSEQDAQALLLKQTGVSEATIKLSGGDGYTLPTDAGRITISVIEM